MKKERDQAALLRDARKKLDKTNAKLAAELGVSEATITAWLAPKTSAKHRTMPRVARFLLAAILRRGSNGK